MRYSIVDLASVHSAIDTKVLLARFPRHRYVALYILVILHVLGYSIIEPYR